MEMDPPFKRPRPYEEVQLLPPLTGSSSSSAVDLPSSSSSSSLPSFPPFASYPLQPPSTSSSASGSIKKAKRKVPPAGKSRLQDLQKGARPIPALESLDDGIWVGQLERDKMGFGRRYQLVVRQDPARARLCSFKEENVTTDRRPIDPPPIIEIRTSETDPTEFLECTSLFLRATLVAANPTVRPPSPPSQRWDSNGNSNWYPSPHNGANGDYYAQGGPSGSTRPPPSQNGEVDLDQYEVVKTPAGGEATAGEVVLTPEKLKDLNGAFSSFCVFSKLSVRVPGVFRLKMTLYETIGSVQLSFLCERERVESRPFPFFSTKNEGAIPDVYTSDILVSLVSFSHDLYRAQVVKMASVLTDKFEVYSPKRFTGMKESTPLTRHFAHQGLKIKLRAGSTVANIGKTKRAATSSSTIPSEYSDGRELRVIDEDSSRPASRGSRRDLQLPPPIPSVMAPLPGVPFPDLPPYSGSSSAPRQHLPSIGDLSAFSLASSSTTSGPSHFTIPPPHPSRPPHPLTPWQAPPPHLVAAPPSESSLSTPRPQPSHNGFPPPPSASGPLPAFAFRPSAEESAAKEVVSTGPRPGDMQYSNHSYSSSYPSPYAAGAAYSGSHSYPQHGAYHQSGPAYAPGRDREWTPGGGGSFPPIATADETLSDHREGVVEVRPTHRRRDTSSSDGSTSMRHARTPTSPPISAIGSSMIRESPSQPRFDQPRREQQSESYSSDGRGNGSAGNGSAGYYQGGAYSSDGRDNYPPAPNHYFSGSGRDHPSYGARPSSPESHWRSNYIPGSNSLPFLSNQGGLHSPGLPTTHASTVHASSHPHHAGYLHHPPAPPPPQTTNDQVPTTLPPLSQSSTSSSTPSSNSNPNTNHNSIPFPIADNPSRAQQHLSQPSSLRYDSTFPYPPPHHHTSASSMASRPKKAHLSTRGGLDAHGYSHRPNLARDDGALPGSVRPEYPFPYPSQPQHQYFPRGGGTVGTTGSHLGGVTWKEPLSRSVGVYEGQGTLDHEAQEMEEEGYGASSGVQ